MSLYQLLSKVVSLETELSEIKRELERQEVKTKRWKPDDGERYFYINDCGEVRENHWINNAIDKMRFRIGNVFESRKKAKFQVEKLKVVAELKEYATNLRFPSKEIAQQAVEAVGEERVKKYYLEVE